MIWYLNLRILNNYTTIVVIFSVLTNQLKMYVLNKTVD